MKTKKVEIKCFANLYGGWENTVAILNAISMHHTKESACNPHIRHAKHTAVPCTITLEIPERTVTISESELDHILTGLYCNKETEPIAHQLKQKLFGGGE